MVPIDPAMAILALFAFIGLLVFLSLSITILFRPTYLPALIDTLKVLGLALIGKRYSEAHKPDGEGNENT